MILILQKGNIPKILAFFPGHATPPRRQSHTPARAAGEMGIFGDWRWHFWIWNGINMVTVVEGIGGRKYAQMWPETEEVMYVMWCDVMPWYNGCIVYVAENGKYDVIHLHKTPRLV